ncbi:hypothetical protein COX69_00570 [Candidatus Falkowbacteria bacterium CG_4_10_14_0_2_um_filter_48_10]|uniref:Uncharacterized protein n=1 Tax=Candidatus Falkowbacteria bacterium CG23_combo_of_CG06-09_8_20_14_all_49_15 TaxID=1974572 RepID=A0A2G9ZLF3_9BACT|nr:MAG: hypothetical protein COX22_04460 [Candidatus Falkowbacteria bacterium CG23_combo_of_CG06-09_8_20_14_all_49_15]PJA09151.1 MAG: hypothetical protein COX69_00570 [Candidatus Falkowbacteria bacterium CG_4_10_14_0_2_um_filter_48_10]
MPSAAFFKRTIGPPDKRVSQPAIVRLSWPIKSFFDLIGIGFRANPHQTNQRPWIVIQDRCKKGDS